MIPFALAYIMYAGLECWNCGGDHLKRNCPEHEAEDFSCWNCGGDHLERYCPEHQATRALAAAGLRDAHNEIRRLTDNETIGAIIDSCDSLIMEFEHGPVPAPVPAVQPAPVPPPVPAPVPPRAHTAPHYRNPDGVFVWADSKGRWRDDAGRFALAPQFGGRRARRAHTAAAPPSDPSAAAPLAADLGSSVGSSMPAADLGSSVESGVSGGSARSWIRVPVDV